MKTNTENQTSSSPTSMAKNYFNPIKAQVDNRTGGLGITLSPLKLPGIASLDIDLGVQYFQSNYSTQTSLFGLPWGWSFSLSYIYDNRITINGGESYTLADGSASGMQYYEQTNLKLKTYGAANAPTLPYGNNPKYSYKLIFLNGQNQYFDSYGKLICIDDKNGNNQLFYYDKPSNIAASKLIRVIGSEGQTVTLTFASNLITVNYPSGGKNEISFSYKTQNGNSLLTEYTDPIGDKTTIQYKGGEIKNDLISQITYPSQMVNVYSYSTISYTSNGSTVKQDAVSAVASSYGGKTRTVTYDYNGSQNNHNYLGYPTYAVVSGEDALLQSNDNNYLYVTIVDNGITKTAYEYNRLHLLLNKTVKTLGGDKISSSTTTYDGEGADNSFPTYVNLPANYQYPMSQETIYYNSNGQKQTYKTVTKYNDEGQTTLLTQYQEFEGTLEKTKSTSSAYDSTFGLLIQQDVSDYMPNGIAAPTPAVTRKVNTLSTNKKLMVTSEFGEVNGSTYTPERITTFLYDPQGRVTSKQIAWSDSSSKTGIKNTGTTYSYTADNSTAIRTATTIDFKGNATNNTYDLNSGFLTSVTDALNHQIVYTYDNLGRQLTEVNQVNVKTIWQYVNSENKKIKTEQNGYVSCEYYNGFGDLVKKTDFPTAGGTERITQEKGYNRVGQLVSKSGVLGVNSQLNYTYNPRGLMATKTDSEGNVTAYTYDSVALTKTSALNGVETLVEMFDNQKHVTQKEFQNIDAASNVLVATSGFNSLKSNVWQQTGTTSQNWMKQSTQYDIFKNPIKQIGNGFDAIELVKELSFDLLNNVVSSTQTQTIESGDGSTIKLNSTRTYNELGLLVEEETQEGHMQSYSYTAVGKLLTKTDFEGNVITYTYYADKQLKSTSYIDVEGATITIDYIYDTNAKLLKSMTESKNQVATNSITYAYSLDGKLLNINYLDGKSLIYSYDPNDFLIGFTDVMGQNTIYSYDQYGRSHGISTGAENIIIAYNGTTEKARSGKIKSLTYSNGLVINYSYSSFNQLSEVQALNASGANLLTVNYTYDGASGNVLVMACSSAVQSGNEFNYSIAYTYNGINQLLSDTKSTTTGQLLLSSVYTYDAAGNVLTTDTDGVNGPNTNIYTYDNDNKLIGLNEAGQSNTLSYDRNGNLQLDDKGNQFTYNNLSQMTSFTSSGGANTAYTYYPNGLRATKTTGSQAPITFYYDHANNANIVNELQGTSSASYLILNGNRFARLFNDGTTVVTNFLIKNAKDVLMVVDSGANVVSGYNYTSYGEGDANSDIYAIANNPFQYGKEYFDVESDLYYLRARYYSPRLMCFTSWDSILIFNHYNYANGNPIMNSDPSGHMPKWEEGLIIGAAIVGTALIIGAVIVLTGGLAGPEAVEAGALADGAVIGSVSGAAAADTAATGAAAAVDTGAAATMGGATATGTAAMSSGAAAGEAAGGVAGIYGGSMVGSAIGEAVGGEVGGMIGSYVGGAVGGYMGAWAGASAAAAMEVGADAGVAAGGVAAADAGGAAAAATATTAATTTTTIGDATAAMVSTNEFLAAAAKLAGTAIAIGAAVGVGITAATND